VTFRAHPITGDPILVAPERAARPRAFGQESGERCPFCPGHEADTPAEIARIGDPWRVRVFPNKYPAAVGAEVIVESARHTEQFESTEHAEEIVRTYADRYRAHAGAAYVSIFKNEGVGAGASIDHLHSQLVPLAFVPPRIEREMHGFARASACPLCNPDGHIIRETESFRWLAPAASSMAYQQWLVPKRHVQEISTLDESELAGLAELLRSASAATRRVANAMNWMLMNFPRASSAHFYVDLFPRLTNIAGFELGTGTFVEIIDPAAAGVRLGLKPGHT
jgi:UDPglucose--hexose-1-phosphate uridylyltransferase